MNVPVLPINSLFKIIFQVKLSYQHKAPSPRRIEHEHREASSVSLMNTFLKAIF